MEALLVEEIPAGDEWQYEPKWDGFRCLAFREGAKVELQSKSGQPLTRYFPELVAALTELKAQRFVLDGEIAILTDGTFSFDALLQRIHPAARRVKMLARDTPAIFVVFDLLVDADGQSLISSTLKQRRQALVRFARYFPRNQAIHLSPATTDRKQAQRWFAMAGGALDGIVAKRLDMSYRSGERTGMQKVKRLRTADCVVGGFRYSANSRTVGSLLLGLYDSGLLHHVGFTSGFSAAQRKSLLARVEPLIRPPGFTGSAPGGPSRWNNKRSAEWEPLAPKLVVEVQYDHFTDNRFRHGTRFLRWRPDKAPKDCLLAQVQRSERPVAPKILRAMRM
jgi:ATP-dependent DNA ligase